MVLRVRSSGRGWGHGFRSGSGIQPNLVQYETRHSAKRGADHFPKRHEANPRPHHGPVPHSSEYEGPGGPGGGVGVPSPTHRRRVHRRGHVVGRPFAPAELAGHRDSRAAQAHQARYCGVTACGNKHEISAVWSFKNSCNGIITKSLCSYFCLKKKTLCVRFAKD